MKKYLKLICLMCCIALMFAVVSGCGDDAPPDTGTDANATTPSNGGATDDSGVEANLDPITMRFSWWGGEGRNLATLDVIDQFVALHPHITIEPEYMSADGYPERMKVQLSAGTAPDIIQSDVQWTDDLRRMGDFFVDLNNFSHVLDISGFDPNLLEGFCIFDGELHYLPTGLNTLTFIFNTEIMERVGIDVNQAWTWETLISEGRRVNEASSDEWFLALGQTALQEVLRSYIRQLTGEQFIRDDYTLGFTREQAIAMFELAQRMFDENVLQPAEYSFAFNLQTQMMNPDWVNRQFAGTIDLTSVLGGIIEPFADTVDVALMPIMSGATNSALSMRPAQIIGINIESNHQEEAAMFLNHFFNNEEAIITLRDTRSIQPTERGRQISSDADVVNPAVARAVELAANAPVPNTPENGPSRNAQVIVAFVDAVEMIGYGAGTPEQAADQMIAALNIILEQLRAAS